MLKRAWLTTNRTCNNNCTWCYAKNSKIKNSMDISLLKKYIDSLIENGVEKFILIGGEPTIYESLFDVLEYIKLKKTQVSMATNERKFSNYDFAKKIVQLGINSFDISLKGTSEEEYLELTGCSGLYEAIKGINNLEKLGAKVCVSYVMCENNKEKFIRLKNLLLENNINNILLELYKPSIENDYNDGPSINELADICLTAYKIFKNSSINYKFEMSIPLCVLDKSLLEELEKNNKIKTCCHITTGRGIVLDTNFNILPCNHFVNHPLNKDKIIYNDINDFWHSELVKEFRKVIKTYPSIKCKECKKWTKCGGGCFLRWMCDNPDDYINNEVFNV